MSRFEIRGEEIVEPITHDAVLTEVALAGDEARLVFSAHGGARFRMEFGGLECCHLSGYLPSGATSDGGLWGNIQIACYWSELTHDLVGRMESNDGLRGLNACCAALLERDVPAFLFWNLPAYGATVWLVCRSHTWSHEEGASWAKSGR